MKEHCISAGIYLEIPQWIQNLIWFLWETADVSEKDIVQSFHLSCGNNMQKIAHSQKQPPYHKVIMIPSEEPALCAEIIILETSNSLLMMLESEY